MRAAAVNSLIIALYYAVIGTKLTSAGLSYALFGAADCGGVALTAVSLATVIFCVFFLLRGGARALSVSGRLSVTLSLAVFSVLAVLGFIVGGSAIALDFSRLLSGSVWVDALGQSLLALSLAAGVMPTFARTVGQISVKKCAFAIICCNFCGCVLAMYATLPFVADFPQEGGISCAMQVYPQVLGALFKGGAAGRIAGTAVFAVLAVVAVHSLASLATPAASYFSVKRGIFPHVFCISALILFPVFNSCGMQPLSACDRMACSVTAVLIALAECVFFAWWRDISGVTGFFLRFICPAVCLVLAVFSLCSARFGCFPLVATACAFVCLTAAAVSTFLSRGVCRKLTFNRNCDKILGR